MTPPLHAALGPLAAVSTTGGSPVVVALAVLLFGVASVLSVLVTYRLFKGYRRTGGRPHLLLAVGVFLLTAAPLAIRLVAPNVAGVPPAARVVAASASELAGLLVILYTIHR